MLTKSVLTATAIALVATIGTASAGEGFRTLVGVPSSQLTPLEMELTRGTGDLLNIYTNRGFSHATANHNRLNGRSPWIHI